MNKDEIKRLRKIIISTAVVLTVGFLYYLFIRISGRAVGCIIYEITGLYCPGCGVTRAVLSLLELDFQRAIHNNAFIVAYMLPTLVFACIRGWKYVKGKNLKYNIIEKIFVVSIIVFAIVFDLLRNIPEFSFLAAII